MSPGLQNAISLDFPNRPPEADFDEFLTPFEIRSILAGSQESIASLAASARLQATDPKGDTPLHLAARVGNLALCDLLVQRGANPKALNQAQQTPAEVASAENHRLVAELLSALTGETLLGESVDEGADAGEVGCMASQLEIEAPATRLEVGLSTRDSWSDDLPDLLSFEAEDDPSDYFKGSAETEAASGSFVGTSVSIGSVEGEGDWALDLSVTRVLGEGIEAEGAEPPNTSGDYEFLKVLGKGRQSLKRTRIQSGTRLSIQAEHCLAWATEVLQSRWIAVDDIESLVTRCQGNGDPDELYENLRRNLEAAGLAVAEERFVDENWTLWEAGSGVSAEELAEAVEALLTRATELPGTQRFIMDKSKDAQLLQAMVRARQELQIGVLGCREAVDRILATIDRVRSGEILPCVATLRAIVPSRPDQAETIEFFAAAEALKRWNDGDRVLDGKRRREALEALDALELPMEFLKQVVEALKEREASCGDAMRLDRLVVIHDAVTDQMIHEHLPYVRRFASRNALEMEEPEEVFQVAFMGLQRSVRRFDPERGYRFAVYCTFWMKQTLARWRADEGSAIRIPVHRFEEVMKLDRVMEGLEQGLVDAAWHGEVAASLGWPLEKVGTLREIPRQAEYLESTDDWDELLGASSMEDDLHSMDVRRVVAEVLSEMPERQANVLRMRFGIDCEEEMTLEEVGKVFGVTRERIRQIESKTLGKLPAASRERLASLLNRQV